MSIGDTVKTEYGKGVIVDIEPIFYNKRYGLTLENNPFFYDTVYFWPHELEAA